MNRRRFIQSLAAAFALPAAPALSFKPVAAAVPAAAPPAAATASAMATKARFWAIYTCGKQGSCTPATLSTVLGIPETQAKGHLTRLVADGTIRSTAILRKSVAKVVKETVKSEEGDGVLGKVRERIEWMWEDEGDEGEDFVGKANLELTEHPLIDVKIGDRSKCFPEADEDETDKLEGTMKAVSRSPYKASDLMENLE